MSDACKSFEPEDMKRTPFLLFFTVLLLSGARADDAPPPAEPEYYYTRVMYNGVGTPERGGPIPMRYQPLRNFKCSDLEPGEGGFGGGWHTVKMFTVSVPIGRSV